MRLKKEIVEELKSTNMMLEVEEDKNRIYSLVIKRRLLKWVLTPNKRKKVVKEENPLQEFGLENPTKR